MRKKSKGDTWDGIFADPEVGRVLKLRGLIADANKSSIEELATITSLSSYFKSNKVLTKFPELKYCTGLSSLYEAFEDCSNLTEVGNIPDGVTTMFMTFGGCESLVNAPSIPSSVTNMQYTFRYCSNLTEAPTIPNSVTIMTWTFEGCSSLISAPSIPSRVTDMRATFYGCSSLTEAPIIPEGVTRMQDTFNRCSSLDGIFIMKPINPPYYYNTFYLANVVPIYVPDESVDSYKSASGWRNHSSKIYPRSDYWDGIFANPEVGRVLHANGLIADANISSIEELATITSLNPSGGNTTSYFFGNKVITKFPELRYCTGLSDMIGAFYGCSSLTEVGRIPEGVTNMDSTFYGCSSLTEIGRIPEGVTNMDSTFYGCSSLTEAPIIPEGVTSLAYTFYGCSSLVNDPSSLFTHPVIPEGVTNMDSTFYGCSSLTEAPIIPEGVTNMGSTFDGCSNLDGVFAIKPVTPPTYFNTFQNVNIVEIYVPDESIDVYKTATGWSSYKDKFKPISEAPFVASGVFADPEVGIVLHANGLIADAEKSSVEELATITSLNPDGSSTATGYFYNNKVLTKFPELKYLTGLSNNGLYGAFRGCSNLTEVGNIPEGVTTLYYTLYQCSSLINAPTIPSRVTDMDSTFYGCSSLTEAPIIPEGVTNMRYTFGSCSIVNAPTIPNSVTNVIGTFSSCSKLVNAPVIPYRAKDMSYTFYNCTSLVKAPEIHSNVTNMYRTFRYCKSLDGIFIIRPSTPPTYENTFQNVKIVKMYVPDHVLGTYKTKGAWSNHAWYMYSINKLPK